MFTSLSTPEEIARTKGKVDTSLVASGSSSPEYGLRSFFVSSISTREQPFNIEIERGEAVASSSERNTAE